MFVFYVINSLLHKKQISGFKWALNLFINYKYIIYALCFTLS
jgi:hypothetical protein